MGWPDAYATAANEADVEQVGDLLHGKEEQVWADSGYRGAPGRVDRDDLQWHIAARPSDIAKLPEGRGKTKVQKAEHRKASMRAKVRAGPTRRPPQSAYGLALVQDTAARAAHSER